MSYITIISFRSADGGMCRRPPFSGGSKQAVHVSLLTMCQMEMWANGSIAGVSFKMSLVCACVRNNKPLDGYASDELTHKHNHLRSYHGHLADECKMFDTISQAVYERWGNRSKTPKSEYSSVACLVNCPWNSVINKIHGQMIFGCGSFQFLCGDREAHRERRGCLIDKPKWPAADFSLRNTLTKKAVSARYEHFWWKFHIIMLPFHLHWHTYWLAPEPNRLINLNVSTN